MPLLDGSPGEFPGAKLNMEIRELKGAHEIEELIRLQERVYGLSAKDVMSPITLTSMTQEHCKTGWILGAFDRDEMVAFCIGLATIRPGEVYGHMLGVSPEYRDMGIGSSLLSASFDVYRRDGMRRVWWTYEPLEARNACLYLNRFGARCIKYLEDYYHVNSERYRGIPLDRFLVVLDLFEDHGHGIGGKDMPNGLSLQHPADEERSPESPIVLVEIPSDYETIRAREEHAAAMWRRKTRALLKEYVNMRGMAATALFCRRDDNQDDKVERRFYLLEKVNEGDLL